ncbi:hypothetical protein QBC45DRAFT_163746 [Copromyces sp. CBS 386.78]|nr:hypothetical protein QBC45DRAFT_163746 [Copromyces sp. CBS 386.78]
MITNERKSLWFWVDWLVGWFFVFWFRLRARSYVCIATGFLVLVWFRIRCMVSFFLCWLVL